MVNGFGSEFVRNLQRPENRAALLQAGIELLQPARFGDNLGSQIGRAIGAGAQARERNVAQTRAGEKEKRTTQRAARQEERADRRVRVAERQAGASERRASAAETRAARPVGLSSLLRSGVNSRRKFISDAVEQAQADLFGERNLTEEEVADIISRSSRRFDQIESQLPAQPQGATTAPAPLSAAPSARNDAGNQAADSIQAARDAIARGADRNAVAERLRQNGIDPVGL